MAGCRRKHDTMAYPITNSLCAIDPSMRAKLAKVLALTASDHKAAARAAFHLLDANGLSWHIVLAGHLGNGPEPELAAVDPAWRHAAGKAVEHLGLLTTNDRAFLVGILPQNRILPRQLLWLTRIQRQLRDASGGGCMS